MNGRDNNTANTRTLLGPRYHHPILLPKPVPTKIHEILDLPPPAQHINYRGHHEISMTHRGPVEQALVTNPYGAPDVPVSRAGYSYSHTSQPAAATELEVHIAPHTMVERRSSGDHGVFETVDTCGDRYHHVHCGCGTTERRDPEARTYLVNGVAVYPITHCGMLEYEHSSRSWNHRMPLPNNGIMHYHEYGAQNTIGPVDHRCRPLFCGNRWRMCPCIQGRLPARK